MNDRQKVFKRMHFSKEVKTFVIEAGIKHIVAIEDLLCGGNNQVYKLITENSDFLLKYYFEDTKDHRDRLETEFSFLTFLSNNGIKSIPTPIFADKKNRLGVFEYINGKKIKSEEINSNHVKQAWQFLLNINKLTNIPYSSKLPDASDSCFTLQAHFSGIENRLENLKGSTTLLHFDEKAKVFFFKKLIPSWKVLSEKAIAEIKELKIDLRQVIPPSNRCLSPSDFGFHNSILREDGSLVFIDFEYAGWDAPIKVICDFLCQPEIPIPEQFWNIAIKSTFFLKEPTFLPLLKLLIPIYRIKWCCIMMNHYLLGGRKRANFTNKKDYELLKTIQLKKTESYFSGHLEKYL